MNVRVRVLGVWVVAAGCGPGSPVGMGGEESGGSSGVAESGTTVGGAPTTTTTVPTSGAAEVGGSTEMVTPDASSSGGSSTSADGQNFIVSMDGGGRHCQCDVFAQDCPRGDKCSAYADDGGSAWNCVKCVPVMEEPALPGEPCFVVGNGVSGVDNCDLGAMCWDVDAENKGTCVALCTGSPEAPVCPPGTACAVSGSGVLNLCLPTCDPLAMDACPNEDLCVPSDGGFECVLDASGVEGQVNDPCEFENSCDPGLGCIDSAHAAECDQAVSGCCQPFCDVSLANTCTGAGQECVRWFEEGTAPPGYEDVGICAVPVP